MQKKYLGLIGIALISGTMTFIGCTTGEIWDPNTPENNAKIEALATQSLAVLPSSIAQVSSVALSSGVAVSSVGALSSGIAGSSIGGLSSGIAGSSIGGQSSKIAGSSTVGSSTIGSSANNSSKANSSTATSSIAASSSVPKSSSVISSSASGSCTQAVAHKTVTPYQTVGDKVIFNGKLYECISNTNSWYTPAEFGGAWKDLSINCP
jgi:hypothetical protein